MNAIFLAWAYLRHHWLRTLVLVVILAVVLLVPFATRTLLATGERQLTARADASPLLLGRRGSALDLAMNALYFAPERPTPITMADVEAIWDSGLAMPIPLHTAFESGGFRIVGTSLDYFSFRKVTVAQGRQLAVLGEAVLGANVARRLGKSVGDTLISAPQSLFDLDGVYPLEMPVVGILAATGSPDDEAIFVDIKTAWVIAGIGHGHDDVVKPTAKQTTRTPDGKTIKTTEQAPKGDVVAPANIVGFQRITPKNIESFHFHGDPASFPLSAALVVPNDMRAATILRGRYLDKEGTKQLIVPSDVIKGLIERLFRIKTLLDAVTLLIGMAALAAVGLALFLAYGLREREMMTAFKLGAQKGMVARLMLSEIVIILGLAGAMVTLLAFAIQMLAQDVVRWLTAL